MKCDGCPFPEVLGTHMDWVRGLDPAIKQDCHLTPDLQRIIEAMIAGEWTCESCNKDNCLDYNPNSKEESCPCKAWQPKE